MGVRVRCAICGHVGWARDHLFDEQRRNTPRGEIRAKQKRQERVQRSRKGERTHAERYGGRTQPRSGGGPVHKLDVIYDDDLEEHKETEAKSFRFVLTDWFTARMHAMSAAKRHVWVLKFIRPGLPMIKLAVLDYDDYQSLKEAARGSTENDR